MDLTEMYGPVISAYSRAQAIEDGVLIDVSDSEGAKLFKFPAVITAALHSALTVGAGKEQGTFDARLWDVFYMLTRAVRHADGESDVFYRVRVGAKNLSLWGNIGPGDDPAPVLTVGFPEDR